MPMKLQEIFELLTSGEFSQISLGGDSPGVISESHYVQVTGHIQLGLTALYKRFNLKERRLSFQLEPGADTYALDAADLLKVERVLVDSGAELPLNDNTSDFSCFTPTMSSLRLAPRLALQNQDTPEVFRTSGLQVVYRANHPKLLKTNGVLVLETKQVEIPPSHVEALLYFVASRAHNPIGMVNDFHAGNTWQKKYELECQRLEHDGFYVQTAENDTRFRDRGWV